jgi:hypothetical protein
MISGHILLTTCKINDKNKGYKQGEKQSKYLKNGGLG